MSSPEHSRNIGYDRRSFLATLGCTGAALLLPKSAMSMTAAVAPDTLLCLGSFGHDDVGTVHLIAMQNGHCERLSSAATERPLALATHPTMPILYVANGVKQYRHEPRGTVDAFVVDAENGRLELLARQPLSLSATDPRALAVAPDGNSLLVAAFDGGAYNVLPLNAAGVPGAPSTILKQVGRGFESRSQPADVLFHPHQGWAVAADFGADRLDVLCAESALLETRKVMVRSRLECGLASGPSRLAFHPSGQLLVAMQQRSPAMISFRVTRSGTLSRLHEVSLISAPTAMAFHPRADVLYSSAPASTRTSKLETWQINPETGHLVRAGALNLPIGDIRAMACAKSALWLASDRGLMAIALDHCSATPQKWDLAAAVPGSSAVALMSGS